MPDDRWRFQICGQKSAVSTRRKMVGKMCDSALIIWVLPATFASAHEGGIAVKKRVETKGEQRWLHEATDHPFSRVYVTHGVESRRR